MSFPVLTPLAIDPAHPFPFIPNFGFTIALELIGPGEQKNLKALIRLPAKIERFIRLPDELGEKRQRFVALESRDRHVHAKPVSRLSGARPRALPGHSRQRSRSRGGGRGSRSLFESALKRRRLGSVIRLEFDSLMPEELRALRRRGARCRRRRKSSSWTGCWP